MKTYIKRLVLIGALLVLVSLQIVPSAAQEMTTVKFGNLPYLDYAPWALAEELGYLAEEGIVLDTSIFEVEQPMVEALINGSIEVGAGSDTPFIILSAAAPELRLVSMNAIFTGYSIMGRPDEVQTYDQFVEAGMSHEEALAAAAAQLEGKTIILPGGASFTPVLDTALEYAGLTRDDVETIDIDPEEGAAAFIQGTGDFYSDGLPMRLRLEQEGMTNVLTGVQLAGGAMVLAGVYTTDAFLAENPDVIEGMLRAWYRTIDYVKANPDEAIPVMVDWINAQTNAGFTVENAERFMQDLILFPTYAEIRDEYFYNPDSPFFWKTRLEFVVNYFGEQEGLDTEAIDLETLVPAPDIFPNVEPPEM